MQLLARTVRLLLFPLVLGGALLVSVRAIGAGVRPSDAVALPMLGSALAVLVAERLFPHLPAWQRSHRDVLVDLCHVVSVTATSLLVQRLLPPLLAPATAFLTAKAEGPVWPATWPWLAQLALALVVAELFQYWSHRLSHEWEPLWRLHATHHSAPRLYFLNAARFHPLDIAIDTTVGLVPLVLLGAGGEVQALFALFTAVFGYLQHCNVAVALGPFNYLFSMAELHRWHHAKNLREANTNYGSNLILWDLVFGSFFWPRDRHPPEEIGIPGMPAFPQRFWAQLLSPFRWRAIEAASSENRFDAKGVEPMAATKSIGLLTALWLTLLVAASPSTPAGAADLDRSVLPIPEPAPAKVTEVDARQAKAPARFEVKAPAGAPNVLIVLIDDMGFGQSSAFGGPIHMPTVEALAAGGLRYNEFHTTALCSPTRTALLTGRNHHMNNMGGITEVATAFPGNTGIRPQGIAPLAEILRLNGYGTAAFGKYHEAPAWEISLAGPFDRWPTHSGFDKFYGFMGGETNQWFPLVFDGTTHVTLAHDPHYNFMTDMTDQAIRWVQSVSSLTPDRPFFLYFAPGATHAPHQPPKEWIAKYKGKFDAGWDALRERTLARQIELGVVPAGTPLAPRPEAIKAWDALTPDEKRLFARQMEIFAGFGEYADHEIGRLIQTLRDLGRLDDTLVLYIVGDNGASAEGGMNGMFNEMTYFNGVAETVADQLKRIDELGGPKSFGHYAAGWAVAGDTPFTWTKQVASSYGGTRNPLVVSWPKGIQARGELRSQWHHVIDVAPTVLEVAGIPQPEVVNGSKQIPIQGVSMAYSFGDPRAKDRHTTQYFEIVGNRGLYHEGWLAGTVHKAPWELQPRRPLADDVWELYDTRSDFSLVRDLAAQNPDKLQEMQALFLEVAAENHVLPIDDRSIERFNAAIAGRPDLLGDRRTLTVYPGMTGMMENAFINIKNRSYTITAEIEVPKANARGVILAQGGRFGGWSLWLKDGRPVYSYNWLGLHRYDVAAARPLPAGRTTLRFEFAYDGGKPGAGGTGRLFAGDQKLAEGRIDQTQPNMFSLDDAADVGMDEGTPVSEAYQSPAEFGGRIRQVTIDVQPFPAADEAADERSNRSSVDAEAASD